MKLAKMGSYALADVCYDRYDHYSPLDLPFTPAMCFGSPLTRCRKRLRNTPVQLGLRVLMGGVSGENFGINRENWAFRPRFLPNSLVI